MNNGNNRQNALETMSILALACIIIGLIFKLQAFFYAALCLLVIGVFLKSLSVIISDGWLKIAQFLGFINARIILTLIFFLFLTPIACLYRLFHGDFLSIKRNDSIKSYFVERDHEYVPKNLDNVW